MGDKGNGYGSKWQLHDFLDNRKEVLNDAIKEQTAIKGAIEWLDYPNEEEYKGIDFPYLTGRGDFDAIKREWEQFWPQTGNAMNWDGIFNCNGEIVMVEAKAHTKELSEGGTRSGKSGSDKGKKNRQQIESALAEAKAYFGVDEAKNWIDSEYYQLANHLAFIYFLNYFLNKKCNVKARLLNIYFLNGWDKAEDESKRQQSVKTQGDWQAAIDAEYSALGIDKSNSRFQQYVSSVFVDCTGAV